MEPKLQKLKVTELKELLHAHGLVQTGKKDDLVKRLIDAGISPPDQVGNGNQAAEELVDPDETETEVEPTSVMTANPVSLPTVTAEAPVSTEPAPSDPSTLSADQQARKARAERFGIPFNPNPASSTLRSKPTSATAATESPTTTTTTTTAAAAGSEAAAAAAIKTEISKPGAIDKTPLGISEDVLARRAAKFGPVEKRPHVIAVTAATVVKPKLDETELTPEMKEKIAIEEEKKRKRAERWGTTMTTAVTTESNAADKEASDAKKVKV